MRKANDGRTGSLDAFRRPIAARLSNALSAHRSGCSAWQPWFEPFAALTPQVAGLTGRCLRRCARPSMVRRKQAAPRQRRVAEPTPAASPAAPVPVDPVADEEAEEVRARKRPKRLPSSSPRLERWIRPSMWCEASSPSEEGFAMRCEHPDVRSTQGVIDALEIARLEVSNLRWLLKPKKHSVCDLAEGSLRYRIYLHTQGVGDLGRDQIRCTFHHNPNVSRPSECLIDETDLGEERGGNALDLKDAPKEARSWYGGHASPDDTPLAIGVIDLAGSREELASIVICLMRGVLTAPIAHLDHGKSIGLGLFLTRKAFALGPKWAYEKPQKCTSMQGSMQDALACALLFLRADFFASNEAPRTNSGTGTSTSQRKDEDAVVHEENQEINPALLYAAIKPDHGRVVQPLGDMPELVPTLRDYQARAVRWMLEQENVADDAPNKTCQHWRKVCDLEGRHFHVNAATGQISRTPFLYPPQVRGGILADEMGLGKTVEVLACVLSNRLECTQSNGEVDVKTEANGVRGASRENGVEGEKGGRGEMGGEGRGMGWDAGGSMKGHEVWVQCEDCSAWVGLDQTPYKSEAALPEEYVCGHCARARAKHVLEGQAKATLIICPEPILEQWQEEIEKHVHAGALKVFTYKGQNPSLGLGGSPKDIVTAGDLSECDIVLCSYNALASDIHKDSEVGGGARQKVLRYAKKYQKIPTPLTRLTWWRVCLDEAQMVQSGTASAALMALRLKTKYRWCVSGTPINRGLEDLYGLMLFLQAPPYNERYWWNALIQQPCNEGSIAGFRNLTSLLQPSTGGLMWRTRKVDVKDDLDLQPQIIRVSKLELSNIERHFYKKQHQECYAVAKHALPSRLLLDEGGEEDLPENRTLKPTEASRILSKLLRLRQACCHPQVGSQGIKSLATNAKPLSMDEILDMLIAKARTEAEDVLRIIIFCANGLASIFQLEKRKVDAVKAYREALTFMHDYAKSGIQTDSLQKLHTVHNLSMLLEDKTIPVAPTLRDSQLQSEAQALKKKYLQGAATGLMVAKHDFRERQKKVLIRDDGDKFGSGWWLQLLRRIEDGQRAVPAGWRGDASKEPALFLVDQIKTKLSDRAAAGVSLHGRNSTSLVHKFSDISGLTYVLNQELLSMFETRMEAIAELVNLESKCREESPTFIYEVSHCSKCRGELGTTVVQCSYCKLDDLLMRYEARIFSLRTQTARQDTTLSAADAARAQEAAGGLMGGWGRMAGRTFHGGVGGGERRAGRGARGGEARWTTLGVVRAAAARGASRMRTCSTRRAKPRSSSSTSPPLRGARNTRAFPWDWMRHSSRA